VHLIQKYFPHLTKIQLKQFGSLEQLYQYWNVRINIISRKDISYLYERHILHSLSIAKVIEFLPGMRVLDMGTGGGFPGIPLAIMFPEVDFHLVDSVGKKIKVVQQVAKEISLQNVLAEQQRAEDLKDQYNFVVCRAVSSLSKIHSWTKKLLIVPSTQDNMTHGWLCLKGGAVEAEIEELGKQVIKYPISDFFEEPFFQEKYVLYIPLIV